MNAVTDTPTQVSDKRSAILATTLELLSEHGLHNNPTSVIVKESGASTGIVYHFFASKDELITELHWEIKVKGFQTLPAGYDEDTSYQERYLYLWKIIIHYYMNHPQETKFLEQYEHSPNYDVNWSANYADLIKPLVDFSGMALKKFC